MKSTEHFSLTFDVTGLTLEGFRAPNGTVWFQAKSVCDALGMTNPSRYIKDYCDPEDVQDVVYGRGRPQRFILEYAVYDLVFESKAVTAKSFKKWISHEVLPSIRKQGSYISADATSEQLELAKARIAELEAGAEALAKGKMIDLICDPEKLADFMCEADAPNGDPLVHMDFLRDEERRLRGLPPAVTPNSPAISGRRFKVTAEKPKAARQPFSQINHSDEEMERLVGAENWKKLRDESQAESAISPTPEELEGLPPAEELERLYGPNFQRYIDEAILNGRKAKAEAEAKAEPEARPKAERNPKAKAKQAQSAEEKEQAWKKDFKLKQAARIAAKAARSKAK